jgi:hypothetical protein
MKKELMELMKLTEDLAMKSNAESKQAKLKNDFNEVFYCLGKQEAYLNINIEILKIINNG